MVRTVEEKVSINTPLFQDLNSVWRSSRNVSVRRKQDGARGVSDRSRSGAEKGGRKRGRLKDGGVGTRVEGDGRDCGGGEGCVEESL